jgi:uncharacterized membrane protein YoaK (UPF0700 family)
MSDVLRPQALTAGRICAAGLGLVAGFADAAGYMRWHAFGANMTGNTIFFAISLYRDAASALGPLSIIVAFIIGTMFARLLVDRYSPAIGLLFEAALLFASAFSSGYVAQLGLIALAMGAQNASIASFAGVRANTAFITGDYSKLGQALADIVGGNGSEQRWRTIAIIAPLIAAYVVGALAAALGSGLSLELLIVVPVVVALAYASHQGAFR